MLYSRLFLAPSISPNHSIAELRRVGEIQVGVLYMIAPYVTITESYVLGAMLYRQCSAMKLAIKIIETSRLSLL